MNEQHFASRVRQQLNRGLQNIEPAALDRLKMAREAALSRQKAPATSPVLAGVGHFFQLHSENLRLRHLLMALALFLATALYANWQAEQIIADLEETDSALLAEDAPMEAFVDKGFATWQQDSSQR